MIVSGYSMPGQSYKSSTPLLGLLYSSLIFSCANDLPLRWEGEHVSIYTDSAEQELCAGSTRHMDIYIKRAFAFLNSTAPPDFIVPIYVEDDASCYSSERDRAACYDDPSVFTDALERRNLRAMGLLRHEVAHAVVGHIWGRSAPFFEEGLAEAIARSIEPEFEFPDHKSQVGDLLGTPAIDLDYISAARFTHFLIDANGIADFERVYRASKGRSGHEIRHILEEVYGSPYDSIEQEYLEDDSKCTYQIYSCDESSAEAVQQHWFPRFAVTCQDPDYYGAVSNGDSQDSQFARQWTVRLDRAGPYRIRSLLPVLLSRCGECEEQFTKRLPLGADVTIELEPGLYSLEAEFLGVSHGVLDIEISYVPPEGL